MASLFSHLIIGATGSKVIQTRKALQVDAKLFILAMLSSALPDIDVLAFDLGIPYEHWLGHRGLSHSFVFAFCWALLISVVFYRCEMRKSWSIWLFYLFFFFVVTASHGIIDAMTNGGRGVGFFIPFSDERYFLPFRPIQVSPLGVDNFFSEWGMKVVMSELVWIGLPCFLIWTLASYNKVNHQ